MSLALIFPGQGAQEPGMGRGLLDAGSPAHALASEASDLVGRDLAQLACEGSAEEVRATDVAQPLLLLHSLALLQLVPADVRASAAGFAGHSLGEYSALVAAGSLDWQDAMRLVRERALAMAEASSPDQGMSAVLALDEPQVQLVLDQGDGGVAVIANLNAPGQVVISGERTALEALTEPLKQAGARRVMPLAVGGAFHSPLMSAAADRLGAAIDAAPLRDGGPQAFNIDGAVRTLPLEIAAALRDQLTSPVRWVDCVRTLAGLGADRFVELGPGQTLAGLGRRIRPEAAWVSATTPAAVAAALAA
ncbi:MAG: ACP S-malonyltransferase [Candidatus Dormibacteria bacterium]